MAMMDVENCIQQLTILRYIRKKAVSSYEDIQDIKRQPDVLVTFRRHCSPPPIEIQMITLIYTQKPMQILEINSFRTRTMLSSSLSS